MVLFRKIIPSPTMVMRLTSAQSRGFAAAAPPPPPPSAAKGQIASKGPSKVLCQEGKTYAWCSCGLSNKQPFCDSSHKNSPLGLTPMRWQCTSTKEYFFCCCKQTNNRPMCDGTHKNL